MLSRANVIVESSSGLTCSYWLKATEHLHINREKEKNNKRRERENKLYAQQRHKQHACDLHVMQSRVLLKHFKTFLFLCYKNRFTIIYSNISFSFTLKVVHYLCNFPIFHPMSILQFSLGCCSNSRIHTPKIIFLISKSCRYYLQDKVTEAPVGHFRRLIYSTPNRKGPDTPLRNNQIIYLNRLKPK